MNPSARQLLVRIRLMTWIVIVGLVLSGVTAIPLETELDLLARMLGVEQLSPEQAPSGLAQWILKVREGLRETNARHPFMAYGTDWLAFAHIVIAIGFIGALRDPVRNQWLFQFGLIACFLVIPWALILGGLRGIPFYWRLIDCSFGVFGAIPLWLAQRWTKQLEETHKFRPG
ncbi:MAG: hypothetical protein H7X97_08855 [Opitutaceae bacterium]|nr:hypothetical protein [Verrucomicrobiales bacterium]